MLQLNSLAARLFIALLSQPRLKRSPLLANYDIFDFIIDVFLSLKVVEALSLIAVCIGELMQNVPIVYVTCIHNGLG